MARFFQQGQPNREKHHQKGDECKHLSRQQQPKPQAAAGFRHLLQAAQRQFDVAESRCRVHEHRKGVHVEEQRVGAAHEGGVGPHLYGGDDRATRIEGGYDEVLPVSDLARLFGTMQFGDVQHLAVHHPPLLLRLEGEGRLVGCLRGKLQPQVVADKDMRSVEPGRHGHRFLLGGAWQCHP